MKTIYQKPEVTVTKLQIENACMAASLEITLDSNKTVTSGDAKGNNWDSDDDYDW